MIRRLRRLWTVKTRAVSLDVEIWKKDRPLLSTLPEFGRLATLETGGLTVRVADFIANGLYTEQKRNRATFGDRYALRRLVGSRMSKTLDYFSFDSGTVESTFQHQDDTDTNENEKIGVAGAISVIDYVFALNQSDWQKVPISSTKAIDFYMFSNGKQIAGLEAKCRLNPASVASAVSDIHAKKRSTRGTGTTVPLFGVVVVPASPLGLKKTKCVVCDPVIPRIEADPYKYRLLSRLTFYSDVIASFSRSPFLQALVQRVVDIAALRDYRSLSGSELLNIRGEPYSIPHSFHVPLENEPKINLVGDFMFDADRKALLFIGLVPEVVELLARQRFDEILRYQSDVLLDIEERTIRAVVSARELQKLGLEETSTTRSDGRKLVTLHGAFMTTLAGTAIGEFVVSAE